MPKVWDVSSGQCLWTLTGHTRYALRRRPVEPRVDCSSTPRRAQVRCVAALSKDRVVSGSRDNTLKVWDASNGECLQTLSGHTDWARRRRPVDTTRRSLVDAARAQVVCVAVLPNGRIVSGSDDRTLKVWDASSGECLRTLTGHTYGARRRRPVEPSGRSLVDAARGAGHVRRRPVERPRRVRVGRRHAQGVGRVERSVPPDAERAHERSTAPASSRHSMSIARRRRDGRRSRASPSCRTATSFLGVDIATTRSRCGTCRPASASGR